MLLMLEEYFRDYPVKLKLAVSMYNNGMALRNGKFYSGDMEISLSEVARANNINRRTVYETIKFIENKPELARLVSEFKPCLDRGEISNLIGNQVIMIFPRRGTFSKTLTSVFGIISKYMCHLEDFSARNCGKDELFMRLIFDRPLPNAVLDQMKGLPYVRKVDVSDPRPESEEVICNQCEVEECPTRTVTILEDSRDVSSPLDRQ